MPRSDGSGMKFSNLNVFAVVDIYDISSIVLSSYRTQAKNRKGSSITKLLHAKAR